jgi:hypothetical protein
MFRLLLLVFIVTIRHTNIIGQESLDRYNQQTGKHPLKVHVYPQVNIQITLHVLVTG